MKKIIRTKLALSILTVFLCIFSILFQTAANRASAAQEAKAKPSKAEYAPGQFIVKLKPGFGTDAISELNKKYAVTSMEKIFPETPSPEETLKGLKEKRACLDSKEHNRWYWQLDKDSPEAKDYLERLTKEKESLDQQIKYQENFIFRLERRQKRAPGGVTLPSLDNIYLAKVKESTSIPILVKAYKSHPAVEYAEPDYLVKLQVLPEIPPNDTYLDGDQDGKWDSGAWRQPYENLWGLKKIKADKAWEISQGAGVVVAVVDSGVDYRHEDLTEDINDNGRLDFASEEAEGEDINRNDRLDSNIWRNRRGEPGYDFVNTDADPMDDDGHGTFVAGIIAALANNNRGIRGVAPRAKIMPVKVSSNVSSFRLLTEFLTKAAVSRVAKGIVFAAENDADIINLSLTCKNGHDVVNDALKFAYGKGCVIIAAAGNDDKDIANISPANSRYVIAVAATDQMDRKADFSNWGDEIDIAAPGGDSGLPEKTPTFQRQFWSILSLRAEETDVMRGRDYYTPGEAFVGRKYYRARGTSFAAPYVAGVAALILSYHPDFKNEQVRQALLAGSDDVEDPGFDIATGYGRVNAVKALQKKSPLGVKIIAPRAGDLIKASVIEIDAMTEGADFASWRLEYGEGKWPNRWNYIADGTKGGFIYAVKWDMRSLIDGKYTLRLLAKNTWGEIYEDRIVLEADKVYISEPLPRNNPLLKKACSNFFRSGTPIVIRGSANLSNLKQYTLEVFKLEDINQPRYPAKITLTDNGIKPIQNGTLGVWDTTRVPSGYYVIRLKVETVDGRRELEEVRVILNPSLHPGWPKKFSLEAFGLPIQSLVSVTNLTEEIPPLDHLTAADVNGDRQADLLFGYGNTIQIFDHTGELLPGWPQKIDPQYLGSFSVRSPAVADLDGDASLEVVAVSSLPNGEKTQVFAWQSNGQALAGWPITLSSNGALQAPVIADINADGKKEIILSANSGYVYVLDKEGASLDGWPQLLPERKGFPYGWVSAAAVGDVDGDGKKEIAVSDYCSESLRLFVLRADGSVLGGWPRTFNFAEGDSKSYPIFANIDEDDDLEVLFREESEGKVYAFQYNGVLASGWPRKVFLNSRGEKVKVTSLVAGDIDGDGQAEIVAGSGDSRLYAWDNKGFLLKGWPVRVGSGENSAVNNLATVDLNGDSKADIIASGANDADWPFFLRAYDYKGKEIPDFQIPSNKPEAAFTNNAPAVADLDGDGLLELAWIDFDQLYVWDLEAAKTAPQPWPMFQGNPEHTACYLPQKPHSQKKRPVPAAEQKNNYSPVLPAPSAQATTVTTSSGLGTPALNQAPAQINIQQDKPDAADNNLAEPKRIVRTSPKIIPAPALVTLEAQAINAEKNTTSSPAAVNSDKDLSGPNKAKPAALAKPLRIASPSRRKPCVRQEIVLQVAAKAGDKNLTYEWNLGDGSLKSGRRISHQYLYPGRYPVILRISGAKGTYTKQRITLRVAP